MRKFKDKRDSYGESYQKGHVSMAATKQARMGQQEDQGTGDTQLDTGPLPADPQEQAGAPIVEAPPAWFTQWTQKQEKEHATTHEQDAEKFRLLEERVKMLNGKLLSLAEPTDEIHMAIKKEQAALNTRLQACEKDGKNLRLREKQHLLRLRRSGMRDTALEAVADQMLLVNPDEMDDPDKTDAILAKIDTILLKSAADMQVDNMLQQSRTAAVSPASDNAVNAAFLKDIQQRNKDREVRNQVMSAAGGGAFGSLIAYASGMAVAGTVTWWLIIMVILGGAFGLGTYLAIKRLMREETNKQEAAA